MKFIKHSLHFLKSIIKSNIENKIDNLKVLHCKLYNTTTKSKRPQKDELTGLQTYRINKLGIQMLIEPLYNHLFKHCESHIDEKAYIASIKHLKQHVSLENTAKILPNFDLELPPLQGKTVLDHFNIIGQSQSEKYKDLLKNLIEKTLPPIPNNFVYARGWTKYFSDGTHKTVPYPDCSEMVFDTEVCVKEGNSPTLACAASTDNWYSWCSDRLVSTEIEFPETSSSDLIPLGISSNKEGRMVVGHNVSFDRKFVKEQYLLADDGTRFFDTMAVHIATSGLAEGQRTLLMKNTNLTEKIWAPWMKVGSPNNLAAVYLLHCKKVLDKEARDLFVNGSMSDIRQNFQLLVNYCCKDVQATHEVLCEILPIFFDRFPHPVTFSGMLEMGQMYLPISGDWEKYIDSSEKEFDTNTDKLNVELRKQAIYAVDLLKDEKYKNDLWLWSLDWVVPSRKVKLLQEYPTWYRKLCQANGMNDNNEPIKMSLSLKITPLLLKLTWHGYPLYYDDTKGWGFLRPTIDKPYNDTLHETFPYSAFDKFCNKSGKPHLVTEAGLDVGIPNIEFVKLPHKDGKNLRVGNPLAGNFLQSLEGGILSGINKDVIKVLIEGTKLAQYWKGNRARVLSQKTIWLNEDEISLDVKKSELYSKKEKYGAIIPQAVTSGTVTRRAVERTWMTAANASSSRIGSELKAMVRPPPGYYLVGADVDSEELWIASLLGDANFTKIQGGTAISWMTLQGNKADGTDMHSHTAKLTGITRSEAKIINYARIYGAGVYFMKHLMHQFNNNLSEKAAAKKAFDLYSATRGEKSWYLSTWGKQLADEQQISNIDDPFTTSKIASYQRKGSWNIWRIEMVKQLMRMTRKAGYYFERDALINGASLWHGGSESNMCNALEDIATSDKPRTPFLKAAISRALEPDLINDNYMTCRINWVVQSSAVDYLHLMLVSMNWLFSEYDIKARLAITIHDEIQFIVAEEDRYRAALALHISNLLTRVFFSMSLGMNDLPQSVAFFSSVDVDRALRKDPKDDCITPSNKDGLLKNYCIAKGEALTINDAILKTNGSLRRS